MMTESKTKTDLLGRPVDKEKPGPKEKYYSKRHPVLVKFDPDRYVQLLKVAGYKNMTPQDYLRDCVSRDWRSFGHLCGDIPGRKKKGR